MARPALDAGWEGPQRHRPLLIGPGGVYTVNTKNHPGKRVWVGADTIMVNGQSPRYLPVARFEADRARKLLSRAVGFQVPTKAVLMFLTGTVLPRVTIKQMPGDVLVLDRMDGARRLQAGAGSAQRGAGGRRLPAGA